MSLSSPTSPGTPPVSVVIPTYQRAGVILNALRSVLRECRSGDEVIVVDDGSTDDTESVLAPFRDQITYVRVPNGGAGKARNIGVEHATHELVAFLDSDDEWVPGKLEIQRALFSARPELVLCATDLDVRYPPGRPEWRAKRVYPDVPFLERMVGPGTTYSELCASHDGIPDFRVFIGDLFRPQLHRVCLWADTVMINRRLAGDALWFPQDLTFAEDYEGFGRVARQGPSAYLAWASAIMHMDLVPQLSHAGDLDKLRTVLTATERLWGQDEAFLAEYGEEYRRIAQARRQIYVWYLIDSRMASDARRELALLGRRPLLYRVISRLPAGLASHLLWRLADPPPRAED